MTIIFIPRNPRHYSTPNETSIDGGYYVNLQHANVVQKGGYGRIEFELTPAEIAALESEDPETPVWGDEADLVFSGVQVAWKSFVTQGSASVSEEQLPVVDCPWRYWCAVDENWNVVESW